MFELRTEIHIDAPPEGVWQVLTDGEAFSEWNPFIRRMKGELREGNILDIEVGTPGKAVMSFKPEVLRAEPNRELRWLGKLVARGLFAGEHIFELETTQTGTHFIHRECFTGLLVPFFKGMLEGDTRPGFESMNKALKERVEANFVASR